MSPIPLNQLASIQHPALDLFLLGFATACSMVAGLFFLRFWRDTRDPLFLGFSAFFAIEGISEALTITLPHPNQGTLWLFLLRLVATLAVLGAILWKNTSRR
jgi:uncharacterized membrane protein HdeD (DUF308 family)